LRNRGADKIVERELGSLRHRLRLVHERLREFQDLLTQIGASEETHRAA
jgi:hypothetical protein